MKETLIALCAILMVSTARILTAEYQSDHALLGNKPCTWGPSYWCENLKYSAECSATKHCINKVWNHMTVPKDNDTVCGICEKMVQQARDQLESNQTQEDLRAVFEGSCRLIHITPIVNECINIVDQFIPDLVETLASQMNPSVVCSVAGLCNSAHIDQMLLEYQKTGSKKTGPKSVSLANDELEPDECSKCYTIVTHMEHRFNNMSRDKIVNEFLYICGDLSSFSDACSSIVLTNFDTIYSHLQENFNSNNICHLSGQCSSKFHKHESDTDKIPKVEIRPLSSVGMVEVNDDLPCKLCEQLVGHLRDLLVANTTEKEFQEVLEGLCKQTHSFATECKAIVDEYYPEIYEYLTKGLDSNMICQMSGICPSLAKTRHLGSIAPLLTPDAAKVAQHILKEKAAAEKVLSITQKPRKSEAEEMQLPLERMTIPILTTQLSENVNGQEACALCEYILHYVQEIITSPTTEDDIKHIFSKVCRKLGTSIEHKCEEFVDSYGDAVVAILAQQIDPSQVCPMIHICPSNEFEASLSKTNLPKKYYVPNANIEDKPSCPLCLLAVTQVYNVIKDNKTEANIEAALDKLCNHLPKSLTDQCTDLVKGYSKELVELLLADLTPQEVCVYLKACDPNKNVGPRDMFPTDEKGEILTNEIPQFPSHVSVTKHVKDDISCVICEFAMQYIDKAMSNKKTRDEIEGLVHGICNHLPKTVSTECNKFVREYADVVIEILASDFSPKQVCNLIDLCTVNIQMFRESVAECALCEAIISTIDKLLDNDKIDEEIEDTVSKVCKFLPVGKQNKCVMMMKIYEQTIINLIRAHTDSRKICSKMALCSHENYFAMSVSANRKGRSNGFDGTAPCTWGAAYWCINEGTAKKCGVTQHCEDHYWKGASKVPTVN